MVYLTIGIEGRRMHTRKYPHTNVENITTLQLWEELELTFIRPRNVTFDRYLLLTRRQQKGETMEQFHSALRSMAEFCQLGALEDDLLRDIFTAKITDPEKQKELLKVTLDPEKALELAISIELGARSQAKHTSDSSMVSIVGRSEPVLAISSSRYRGNFRGNYSQPRGTFTQPRGNNNQSFRQQVQHNCRNCGQPWTQDHRAKCQAYGQICRRCNKPNHLAKVCPSDLTRNNNRNINEIEERNEPSYEDNINMVSLNDEIESITHDSEEDYSVNLVSPTDGSATPTKLNVNFGNTKYWVMVDSGSSHSLIMERMAREIEVRDKNSWWSRRTNPVNLRSFTNTPIRNRGTLYCDVECNEWNAGRADLIVVPNNHRALIGRDLFQGLGIQVNQQTSPTAEGNNFAMIENQNNKSLKQEIAKQFPGLIKRIGRSVNHPVKSKFKTNFTPVHQRGRRVPIHLQKQVEEELKKLQDNGNIIKLDKCSDKNFISPIVITVKRDNTIKLAMDSKIINKAIHKNKYQMQNIDCLMDNIAQSISESSHEGEVLFSTIDLRYAYSQLPLDEATAKQCNFNIVGGQATGTYRFTTGFYGLTDMPAQFQKAIDNTLKGLTDTYTFLDDIIIVSGGGIKNHKEKVFKCLQKLDKENLSINLEKCHFAENEIE